jgi:hypothetical protein
VLDIAIHRTELLTEFFGREPVAIARRGSVLLVLKEFLQGTFLLRAALEHEQHAIEAEIERGGAAVKFGASQWMAVSVEDDEIFLVDSLRNARLLRGTRDSAVRSTSCEIGGLSSGRRMASDKEHEK